MGAEKYAAKQVIDALPADATLDDTMYALYVRAKCERADRQVENGEGIPHEEAKRRLSSWQR